MHRFLSILLALAAAGPARAHLGVENDTDVRVFADGMRVIARTSYRFAWMVLGDRAPAAADEAGQVAARPLLAETAGGLFRVTAGGNVLEPIHTDAVFEVGNDVAFVLNFPRPVAWPVRIEARFFPLFTTMDGGTVRVYDSSASRFSRDLEPLVERAWDWSSPAVSFSLAPAPAPAPVPLPVPPAPPATPRRGMAGIALVAVAALAIVALAWHRLKHPYAKTAARADRR